MFYQNRNTDNEKILIVDDVETNRIILEEIIKGMGCNPISAESGEMALEILKEEMPQLILTDISMPGMDGYQFCRMLKTTEKTKDIPVIFISAFDHPEDIVEGLFLGGEDYITKPFVPEVIEARVGVRLSLSKAKLELLEINRRLQISIDEQLKQMEQEKKNVLYALSNLVMQNADMRQGQMERQKKNCRILAQGMQLSPLFEDKVSDDFIDAVELSVPLCDIGKIGISKEILHKRENITKDEVEILKTHTDLGAKFLEELYGSNDYNDFATTAVDVVQCHHEKWDGSGYPNGLKGNEIPIAAQIVSVMEAFCGYMEQFGSDREKTLEALRQEAGTKWNPDIVEICGKISRQLN